MFDLECDLFKFVGFGYGGNILLTLCNIVCLFTIFILISN